MTNGITLSVIVPVFNEQKTILEVLQRIRDCELDEVSIEVVIVDDGSTDSTWQILDDHPDLYAKRIRLPTNQGKGAAVKEGLRNATCEYVLIQDADLEYDPGEYPVLMRPLALADADVVLGSRMIAPPLTRVYYFWHKIGNRLITLLFNVLFNTTFTDLYSGFLVFRRRLVDPEELKVDGWGQHAEIISLIVRRGKGVYEVPISYIGRTYDQGKKIRAHHVIGVFAAIVAGRLKRVT